MENNIPLYIASREHTIAHNETVIWYKSFKENVRCKQAIETAIRENFDGMHLKANCVENVINEFGFDRVEYVLANTLKQLSYDGRFSRSNKEWGENIEVSDDHRNYEFCISSHPAVLDGFIAEYRREYSEYRQSFDFKP